jgi:hypothetical protein
MADGQEGCAFKGNGVRAVTVQVAAAVQRQADSCIDASGSCTVRWIGLQGNR